MSWAGIFVSSCFPFSAFINDCFPLSVVLFFLLVFSGSVVVGLEEVGALGP